MPRVCLRRYGFEKAKTGAELLKVLISLGQDCPNPALLCAGVRNARIPSMAISGRGIQVTLDKQQGLLTSKLMSGCRQKLTDGISVRILLASFDSWQICVDEIHSPFLTGWAGAEDEQVVAEKRVGRSGSVRDHQSRGYTGRILGNILPQQRGNGQGLVLCPVSADIHSTLV
eukprot:730573-Rhodomonas_salina.1